ncbi:MULTISPECIES: DNA topoisomerase III [Brenneria]|uniref:DNA topoisomerase n=1 Tax=Brenneria nigrifluens DSM 30175 = ATCC 13028 TaxID=1121120 RepID=A0A2U1UHB8_9GAMM|nr:MULTISPECIES: DNA topoisomerase III [Brenneria]EHD22964.1 DNA topoisomerase III [Brenneria sp. EniD312]PWC21053.1 DNA topoisomerase III [Brenneria nigrifluens] [Brenneria nigrifluens DSM 30175 = ATCC 13028]QCR06156.1 DNA topoisomerase III [Brenneria nigrifluens] [Brenneria nigrifluens DSM 30175 = ATCC 13028]
MQLYLCEKPSQGKDIGAILGATQRKQGYLAGPGVIVTWAVGHLLEQAQPETYGEQYGNPWRESVLPIVPTQWKMTVKKDTADQFAVVRSLLKQVDSVVIATDADREGEVIARELLEYCHFTGAVQRLWLSALDEASIRQALANKLPGEKTAALYHAGMARARADWMTGMNLTRLYTLKAREQGYGEVLSIGRVQTPALALVVNRDREIASFVSKPHWQVQAMLQKEGINFPANWVPAANYCDEEKRCIQQNVAQAVLQLCQQTGSALILDLGTERKKESAPLAFDLGTLQQVCSRQWGMSANQVLSIAQSLYETHKATTYPRTDCGYLPTSMREEIPQVFNAITRTDPTLSATVAKLDTGFVSRIWNDKKITAHHGIIPTKQPFDLSKLSADELRVYQLIRQHYLAQFLPFHEVDVTEATFNIGGQLFRTRGKVEIVAGWKALFQHEGSESKENDDDEARLPTLVKGQSCAVAGAELKTLQTKPPAHFTDGTLIAAMKNAAAFVSDPQLKKILKENAGLGTEATRAAILETLFKRGYLEKKGKFLFSTPIAGELIDALPAALTNPGMTALWEQALDEIAQGQMTLETFMSRQAQWTGHLVEKGKTQAVKFTAPPSPPCPVCGGAMRRRAGKKGSGAFWGCINYPTCQGIVNIGTKTNRNGKRYKGKTAAKNKATASE